MVPLSHLVVPTSYLIIILSHLLVFFFFFSSFDGFIPILYSTNITYDYTFVIFGSFFIFFSHLMVPLSH